MVQFFNLAYRRSRKQYVRIQRDLRTRYQVRVQFDSINYSSNQATQSSSEPWKSMSFAQIRETAELSRALMLTTVAVSATKVCFRVTFRGF